MDPSELLNLSISSVQIKYLDLFTMLSIVQRYSTVIKTQTQNNQEAEVKGVVVLN